MTWLSTVWSRARPDVPAPGEDGQAEQHDAEDDAEEQLGPLGLHDLLAA